MDVVGFCPDVLGFNSEPNKKLRLTPLLASRGAGIGTGLEGLVSLESLEGLD